MQILDRKKEMLKCLPTPRNIQELRQTLDIFNYYSKFYKNYTNPIYPLLELLKMD